MSEPQASAVSPAPPQSGGAPASAPANPWLRGPPPQIQAARAAGTNPQTQSGGGAGAKSGNLVPGSAMPLPPPPPPVQVHRPKAGRAHHHLPYEEAQIHAYQLGIAQQMAMMAMQTGMDLPSYQIQMALSYGFDPRMLTISPEPGTRLEGSEPALGLTLVKDDQAYTHIELLSRYPHLAAVNFTHVDLEPRKAAFFLVTCHERQVHESLKYGYWTISSEGASALNRAFGEMHGLGPVYFLMASTDSVAFSGICQMMGPASPVADGTPSAAAQAVAGGAEGEKEANAPATQFRIPVRWVFCKNIPFSHMQHVALRPANKEAEEQRRIHGGMQPMKLQDGTRALSIFARHIAGISVLMDFKHYDEAEAKGVLAESGEAAIRAAQRQQQRMTYQPHGQHSQNYRPGGQHQHQQRSHHPQQPAPQLNPSMFPTPAQALNKSATEPSAPTAGSDTTGATPVPAQQAQQQQGEGARPYRGQGYRQPRTDRDQRQGGGPPSRRVVTAADEERVSLQTKYVFEPVVKEKQKDRRRRNKLAQETMDEEYAAEGEEGQQMMPEQEDAQQQNTEGNEQGDEE